MIPYTCSPFCEPKGLHRVSQPSNGIHIDIPGTKWTQDGKSAPAEYRGHLHLGGAEPNAGLGDFAGPRAQGGPPKE